MAGITSYGAYVPLWRLSREAIMKGLRGEKAIRNFDEDSVTMSVAAALDCLRGHDRQTVDGLFFASTTAPYKEKQIATLIAAAVDLRQDIIAADFSNSLRSGVTAVRAALDAVKAGSAKKLLVVAADCRMGAPGTDFESNTGDGAVAFLIENSEAIAECEGWYSLSSEINDIWRRDDDSFVRSWEDRFVYSVGYENTTREAVSGLLQKLSLAPKDFRTAVFAAPTARVHGEIGRKLGFDPKSQVQEPFFDIMGNTGTAYPGMLLVAALEKAAPGDRILVTSYGNGAEAFSLRVNGNPGKSPEGRRGMRAHLEAKRTIDDYRIYLQWRELLTFEAAPTPPGGHISSSAQYRDRSQIFPLHGLKCRSCGGIHFPPQRVCPKCRSKDQFDEVRLSDKKGTIYTFSADNLCTRREAPRVTAVVDFEGGGRMATIMTDRVLEEIKVGMPVEMSFRKIASQDGVHNYFWKSIPVRA